MATQQKTPPVKIGQQIESKGFPGKVLTVSQVYKGSDDWQIVVQHDGADFCRMSWTELADAALRGRVRRIN